MENNTNDKTKLTSQMLEQVKGGAGYIKIGDIKGESQAMAGEDKHKKWSDILSVGFRR